MAHLLGQNLKSYPDDLLRPPSTVNLWERYINGSDAPGDPGVIERREVLQYLSLFKRFGYGFEVVKEAQAIAALIQQAAPAITWPRFQSIIKTLRDRRILQGQTTFYITPKLFHIKLWIDWWQTHGVGVDLTPILTLPPALVDWFFEMFQYAQGSEIAAQTVKALLGEDGLFQQQPELLNTPLGARFFRFLAEADPPWALRCLAATIGTWNREQLLRLRPGRRDIIWALERIAWWRDLFPGAARLLLALAEAENETWANNASGVFAELFSITTYRDLSRTEAPPPERFPVILEAFQSSAKSDERWDSKPAIEPLDLQTGGEVVDTHRVVGKAPDLWVPELWGDVFAYFRRVWQFLVDQLDSFEQDERSEIVKIILQDASRVGRFAALNDMVIGTIYDLLEKEYLDKRDVLELAVRVLRYDIGSLSDDTRQEWEQLKEKLEGTDFHSRLIRYVAMNLVEDHVDQEGKMTDVVPRQIGSLAEEAIARRELLEPELAWLVTGEAKEGYRLGYELAGRDPDLSLLPLVIQAQQNVEANPSLFLLGGYLRGLFERDEARWEELMDSLAENAVSRTWVPELTWRAGRPSDQAALRVLALVQKGVVHFGQLGMFAYGGASKSLSPDVFNQWIDTLLSHPEPQAAYIALDLYPFYYSVGDIHGDMPEQLTLRLLSHGAFFEGNEYRSQDTMTSYHWEAIGRAFVQRYPAQGLRLAEAMLRHFGEVGTIVGGFHPRSARVLADIAHYHPEDVWTLIAQQLEFPITARAYHITQWLRGGDWWGESSAGGALSVFPVDIVWRWVEGAPEDRAWYLASFVPVELFRDSTRVCWAREVLVRYGERTDVQDNLMSNFSTEGWTGPASLHHEMKRQKFLDFAQAEDNEKTRQWIREYALVLQQRSEQARIREERED